ncbi:MAG: hypothetical protein IIZ73_04745 [Ruminococcus sp.]|nr:hypothetical protein [Ruminococcus sp.]
MYCIVCGNRIAEGEECCSNCGAAVKRKKEGPAPMPVYASQEQQAVPPPPQSQQPTEQQAVQPQPTEQRPAQQPMPQYVPPQQFGQPAPQFSAYGTAAVPPYAPVQLPPVKKGLPWYAWLLIALSVLVMLSPFLTAFVPSLMTYRGRRDQAAANRNAQMAYIALQEYATDHGDKSEGCAYTVYEELEYGEIDCEAARDEDGAVGAMAAEMCENSASSDPGYLFIIFDDKAPNGYAIQWRESSGYSAKIGQYPLMVNYDLKGRKPVWGTYYTQYDY